MITQKQLKSFVEVNQIINMDDLMEQTGLTYEEIEEIFKDNKEGINDLEGRMEYNRSMFQVRI